MAYFFSILPACSRLADVVGVVLLPVLRAYLHIITREYVQMIPSRVRAHGYNPLISIYILLPYNPL